MAVPSAINERSVSRERPRRGRRVLGWSFLLGGLVLGGVTALGHFTMLGAYRSAPPRGDEMLDMELVEQTRDLASLYAAAEREAGKPLSELHPAEAMRILHNVVSRRFSHFAASSHNVFSNWIMWGAGKVLGPVFPTVGDIVHPDILLKYGHSALCGRQSYVLLQMAKRAEIPAREVQLVGHVVMEAWYDDEWRMYDTDFEVIGGLPGEPVVSVDQLARNPDRLLQLYAGKTDPEVILRVFNRREIASSYPFWTPRHWKSRFLEVGENIAEVVKFVIPAVLIFIGLWKLRTRPRRSTDEG
jgi:hypothetical protein